MIEDLMMKRAVIVFCIVAFMENAFAFSLNCVQQFDEHSSVHDSFVFSGKVKPPDKVLVSKSFVYRPIGCAWTACLKTMFLVQKPLTITTVEPFIDHTVVYFDDGSILKFQIDRIDAKKASAIYDFSHDVPELSSESCKANYNQSGVSVHN